MITMIVCQFYSVPFTVYEFVVIATNEFGSSPPSPSRRFSTLADSKRMKMVFKMITSSFQILVLLKI